LWHFWFQLHVGPTLERHVEFGFNGGEFMKTARVGFVCSGLADYTTNDAQMFVDL